MPDARGKAKLIYAASPPALSSFLSSFRLFALAAHPIQSAAGKKGRKERNKDCARENWKEMRRAEITSGRGACGHLAKKEAHEDMIPKE